MSTATAVAKDGVIVSTDMPNDEYHNEREHISRSTAHRYRGVYGGRSQRYQEVYGKSLFSGNAATGFGSIIDAACECEMRGIDWRSLITVPPETVLASDGSRRGKAYQEWRASLPIGGLECSAVDFAKTSDIIASIREHSAANELLEAATHTQYSVFWTDEDGHKRKARADGVTPNGWFDLKTTSSEWRELKWSFLRFGYDWQNAWYCDAAAVAGFPPFEFKFIVVQSHAPFDVVVLTLPDEIVAQAREDIKRTLDLIRRRRETGEYVASDYHTVQQLQF